MWNQSGWLSKHKQTNKHTKKERKKQTKNTTREANKQVTYKKQANNNNVGGFFLVSKIFGENVGQIIPHLRFFF